MNNATGTKPAQYSICRCRELPKLPPRPQYYTTRRRLHISLGRPLCFCMTSRNSQRDRNLKGDGKALHQSLQYYPLCVKLPLPTILVAICSPSAPQHPNASTASGIRTTLRASNAGRSGRAWCVRLAAATLSAAAPSEWPLPASWPRRRCFPAWGSGMVRSTSNPLFRTARTTDRPPRRRFVVRSITAGPGGLRGRHQTSRNCRSTDE